MSHHFDTHRRLIDDAQKNFDHIYRQNYQQQPQYQMCSTTTTTTISSNNMIGNRLTSMQQPPLIDDQSFIIKQPPAPNSTFAEHFGMTTSTSADDDPNQFSVAIDVSEFRPDEIKVHVTDHDVMVEGSHDDRADVFGSIARTFTRRIRLPEYAQSDAVCSTLTSNGILTINAVINRPDNSNIRRPILTRIVDTSTKISADKQQQQLLSTGTDEQQPSSIIQTPTDNADQRLSSINEQLSSIELKTDQNAIEQKSIID